MQGLIARNEVEMVDTSDGAAYGAATDDDVVYNRPSSSDSFNAYVNPGSKSVALADPAPLGEEHRVHDDEISVHRPGVIIGSSSV